MIREHDRVVLTVPVSDHGLEPGDEAYEVEFVTLLGQTAAIVTASADQIRPIGQAIKSFNMKDGDARGGS